MQPSHERLDTHHVVIRQRDDGLVPHSELAALDRAPQVGLEPEPPDRHVMEGGVEHGVAARARVLGAVHREVGVADDVLARRVPIGGHGHADAGGGKDVLSIERQRFGRHLLDTLGHAHGVQGLTDPVEQHGELVAAEPGQRWLRHRRRARHAGHDVFGAHGRGQALGEDHQEAVAGGVAEAVVDVLEPVEIYEQHGELVVLAACAAGQRVVEPLLEVRAIGQLREVVVNRVVDEASVRRPQALAHGVEGSRHGGGLRRAAHRQFQGEVAPRNLRGRRGDVAQRTDQMSAEEHAPDQRQQQRATPCQRESLSERVHELLGRGPVR